MRHTLYALIGITSIAIIGHGAARMVGIWGVLPPPGRFAPGTYRSLAGTQFFDDARDIRPALLYDLERLYGSARSITGGTVEPMGTFNLEASVPYGARVEVLSGRYAGDRGYVRADAMGVGRVRRVGGPSNISRKVGAR